MALAQCDLFEAVERCDLLRLETRLNEGANVNKTNSKGRTPLSLAAEAGRLAIVALLLKRGADPERTCRRANNETPLYLAAEKGHSAVVRVLLQHGADMDLKGVNGTPLLAAASDKGHADVVSVLLHHGADVNMEVVSTNYGGAGTPLHLASHRGHVGVVSILLGHGANVEAKVAGCGSTPLHLASDRGHLDVVSTLLGHGANINQVCIRNNHLFATPLFMATNKQHWDVAELLLKQHANIHNAFPLLINGRRTVVKWLSRDESRTILSLRGLDVQGDALLTHANRKLLKNWDMVVAFLWHAFYSGVADQKKGEPPLIADTRSLNNEVFKKTHKWMIQAASSLLFVDSMLDLLRHLWSVFSPNDAATLSSSSEHWGMIPLIIALDTYGPGRDEREEQTLLEGFLFLAKKVTADSLRVRHPITNRIPLAFAIEKGVPLRVVREMVRRWKSSILQPDAVTGLPHFLLGALGKETKYDAADIYEFTRMFLPGHIRPLVSSGRDEPQPEQLPKRKKRRIG